jgi:hypothetical protein
MAVWEIKKQKGNESNIAIENIVQERRHHSVFEPQLESKENVILKTRFRRIRNKVAKCTY